MSLPVVWTDDAIAEFHDAEQWYAAIGLHIAQQFLEAIEDTVRLIGESPFHSPMLSRPETCRSEALSLRIVLQDRS